MERRAWHERPGMKVRELYLNLVDITEAEVASLHTGCLCMGI